MSVFRPSARVRDPDGREWEIYAYRIALPGPGERRDPNLRFLRRLVGALAAVPVAVVRALRTGEWTIQAVAWAPHKLAYTWTTTREYRGQVLAQVEGGLARGELPRPRNAQFRGVEGY